jgi:hypothetical protein
MPEDKAPFDKCYVSTRDFLNGDEAERDQTTFEPRTQRVWRAPVVLIGNQPHKQ